MSKQILAANLRALMHYKGIKSNRAMCLDPRCDVSDRMIGLILTEKVTATIGVIDKIAAYFNIPSWILLIDGIKPSDMDNANLLRLITGYLHSGEEGRELLARMAAHESLLTISAPLMPQTLHRDAPLDQLRRKTDAV